MQNGGGCAAVRACAFAALTCGCGDSGPGVVGGGLDGPDVPLAWSVEAIHEVGGASAAGWDAFGAIEAVGFDGAGNLYVLDGDSKRVTVVARDGSFVRTVGSPGDGPGELAAPTAMLVHVGGQVTLLDAARRSFVDFEADGTYRGSSPIPADAPMPQGALAALPDGSLLGTGVDAVFPSGDDLEGESRPVGLHTRSEGGAPRVVYRSWRPAVPQTRALTEEETGGFRVRLPPVIGFHPPLLAVPLGDGRLVVVDSIDYRVLLLGLDGAGVGSLRRPIEPTPATEAIREAERQRRLSLLGEAAPRMEVSNPGGDRVGTMGDMVRRLEEARIDAMGFQASIPVIERIAVDPSDRIWVQRSSGMPGVDGPTDVLTPAGEYLGTLAPEALRIPDAFGPDGLVAHIVTDEFGVPRVRVGRLLDGT